MRVLFVITHLNFWLPLEPVAQNYCEAGHTVRVLFDQTYRDKFEKRYLFDAEKVPYEVGWQSTRRDMLHPVLKYSREILNYAAYLRVRQPTSQSLIDRWKVYIPRPLRWLTSFKLGRTWLGSDDMWERLVRLDRTASPSKHLIKELKQFNPDVVVAASAILAYSKETDYLKAACHLGIPTVVVIPSWDNLTTKGLLHEVPDWLFVWTEAQADEAEKYHSVPRERVFCTGAPKYDPWFERKPTVTREEFCHAMGIDPSAPYALYLCSSGFISEDETGFISQLAERLAQTPELQNLTLLIRPHPQNLEHWQNYQSKTGNVVIWPRDMQIMNPAITTQDFYHSLLYSQCVLGINTSAFIEAAIVDKPCIAIASSQFELTQMGIPHSRHLLDAGFLELPHTFEETADVMLRILNGDDAKKEKRRNFVLNFVRPNGAGIPATDVMERSIMNVAQGRLPYENS